MKKMRKNWILTAKEKEFIEDWMAVVEGRMEKLEFFRKWSTKKEGDFYEDYRKVENGEISVEEFREKWGNGAWKDYIRVMRHRIERKRRNARRIMESIKEEMALMDRFMSLDEWP
ncbi:MAG: hypothetical protein QXT86_08465 [Archaeoglobaceae archaeon]